MAFAALRVAPEENLSRYLRAIHKFPMLSSEEELELAYRWHNDAEIEAVHKLVTSHLRLVAKIAMGYRRYGLPVGELISEGNIGLMQAVKRFDPDRGFRFATYAVWWIRAAIQEYVLHSWSIVKMGTTAAQKKLFFNLRRLRIQMQGLDDSDLKPEHVTRIAGMLGVPEHEVISMDHRLTALDFSLNVPASSDNTDEWQDWLVDESESQEEILAESEELNDRKAPLAAALKTLSERECHILTGRRLKERPITLEELSHQHGISRERVRQIEARAFEKVQKVVKAEVDQNRRRRHFPRSTVRRAPTQPTQYQQGALIEFREQVTPTAQHAA